MVHGRSQQVTRYCEERIDEAIHTYFFRGEMDCFACARNDGRAYESIDATVFFDASVRQCRRSSGSTVARLAFDRRISTIG